ncbi:hypothetical protein [Mycolicibacterium arseniciresistens]|uniref:PE family protein n=1 Tax=Mycolicibacterium arseniciresistens TaxID=3062257 RepID=A0ABT8ULT1_9MYCO|nr:hypothetical protein [Mycolicibacterium arseniciresistens]MDO3638766.1 hypothetical protein [Mycolicibacterium arseniciresistens]
MSVSVRSYLMAGVAAVGAVTIAIPSLHVAPPDIAVDSTHAPTAPTALTELLESAQRQMEPFLPDPQRSGMPALGPHSVVIPGALTSVPPPPTPPALPGAGPAPLNAASDLLISSYQFIQEWVDWGVDVAIYATQVFGWVPFVPLAGAQIDLFYNQLIRPIADNVVYDFLAPVLNDPLNLGVWIGGAANAIGDSVIDAINFGIQEFNYFFGWAIPPVPPIGPFAAEDGLLRTVALEDGLTGVAAEALPPVVDTPSEAVVDEAPLEEKPLQVEAAPQPVPGGVDVQPEAGVVVEPAPDLVDPADEALDPASTPEIVEDAEQAAGAKPPRVAKRVNERLRKVADDVRTGVRGAVSEATKAADRIRSSLKPKRRSAETAGERSDNADPGDTDNGDVG